MTTLALLKLLVLCARCTSAASTEMSALLNVWCVRPLQEGKAEVGGSIFNLASNIVPHKTHNCDCTCFDLFSSTAEKHVKNACLVELVCPLQEGKAEVGGSIFNLAKNIVGSGILALPGGIAAFSTARVSEPRKDNTSSNYYMK